MYIVQLSCVEQSILLLNIHTFECRLNNKKQMTKSDLVTKIYGEIGPQLTKMECSDVVNTLFSTITEALEQGNSIEIRGFGTFKVRERKARIGQNPNTGESVTVPARRVPVFTPSKIFRNRVDQATSTG